MIAALGHHAVADGAVPWRLVLLLAGAQFAAVWPVARRRFSLGSALGSALAVQGAMHLALTVVGTSVPAPGGMRRPVLSAAAEGDTWRHDSAAMSAVHLLSALAVIWLLHRADAAVAVALGIARAVRGVATAVASWLRSPSGGARVRPLPAVPLTGCLVRPVREGPPLLADALVRRGPPGRAPVPTGPSSGQPPRAVRLLPQGASPCPSILPPARRAVPPLPEPPR
ncbi:hypothetical protein ACFXPN_18090 [Streptomyces griseorubiginosus]|uniref:hypothetical protein n=1 Tax=Streptomyces griseorubiginosus TaxID=67304 RepID=UPI00369FA579